MDPNLGRSRIDPDDLVIIEVPLLDPPVLERISLIIVLRKPMMQASSICARMRSKFRRSHGAPSLATPIQSPTSSLRLFTEMQSLH